MATATKNRKKVRKAAEQPKGVQTFSQADHLVHVTLEQLERHPKNRHPTESQIAAKAESMRERGLLEPLRIRAIGEIAHGIHKTRWQIISGETRWLAAKELGWKTIACREIICDEAVAVQLVAEFNLEQNSAPLNALEKADMIAALCEPTETGGGGLSRKDAAERMRISSSEASNLVRLRKAPQEIQDLIADGRLPYTFARDSLDWLEMGSAQFVTTIAQDVIAWDHNYIDFTRRNFLRKCGERLEQMTRLMEECTAADLDRKTIKETRQRLFDVDPETQEALQAVTVSDWKEEGGEIEVALNVGLWDELQTKAIDTFLRGLDDAEANDADEDPKDKLKERIRDWVLLITRAHLATLLAGENTVALRSILWLLAADPMSSSERNRIVRSAMKRVGVKPPKEEAYGEEWWKSLLRANDDSLVKIVVGEWLYPSEETCEPARVEHYVVRGLANSVPIHLAESFRFVQEVPSLKKLWRDFFELHSTDQLHALAKEWSLNTFGADSRKALIDKLSLQPARLLPVPKHVTKSV